MFRGRGRTGFGRSGAFVLSLLLVPVTMSAGEKEPKPECFGVSGLPAIVDTGVAAGDVYIVPGLDLGLDGRGRISAEGTIKGLPFGDLLELDTSGLEARVRGRSSSRRGVPGFSLSIRISGTIEDKFEICEVRGTLRVRVSIDVDKGKLTVSVSGRLCARCIDLEDNSRDGGCISVRRFLDEFSEDGSTFCLGTGVRGFSSLEYCIEEESRGRLRGFATLSLSDSGRRVDFLLRGRCSERRGEIRLTLRGDRAEEGSRGSTLLLRLTKGLLRTQEGGGAGRIGGELLRVRGRVLGQRLRADGPRKTLDF